MQLYSHLNVQPDIQHTIKQKGYVMFYNASCLVGLNIDSPDEYQFLAECLSGHPELCILQ